MRITSNPGSYLPRQGGYTLIELMIVLVIVSIMLTIGVPSFTRMIRESRVQTSAASLVAAFNMVRAEAIRTGKPMSICSVDDPSASPPVCGTDWAAGWTIFADADGDATIDTGEEFKVGDPMPSVVVGGAANLITFNSRGQPIVGAGSYTLDADNCTSGKDKQFIVDLGTVGRIKMNGGLCP